MNLLDSLLDAIVRLDGDALVMHVGEKPYVVTTSEAANQFRGPLAWGQVELSSRVLTGDAVAAMLNQILPIDQRAALAEFGATEYDVTAASHSSERFTIVAAQGGDDVWLEVRRRPAAAAASTTSEPDVDDARQIVDDEHALAGAAPVGQETAARVDEHTAAPVGQDTVPSVDQDTEAPVGQDTAAALDASPEAAVEGAAEDAAAKHAAMEDVAAPEEAAEEVAAAPEQPAAQEAVANAAARVPAEPAGGEWGRVEGGRDRPVEDALDDEPVGGADVDESDDVMTEGELSEILRASAGAGHAPPDAPDAASAHGDAGTGGRVPPDDGPTRAPAVEAVTPPPPAAAPAAAAPGGLGVARPPALIVPLSRPFRVASGEDANAGGLWPGVLQVAASRGAAALYLVAQSPPMARVDGEFMPLDGAPVVEAQAIARLTAELRRGDQGQGAGDADEWMTEVPGFGRVRCLAFHDHRGPGLIFRMLPPRVLSADQLGLTPEVQALCSEADGLVLVAGGRRSGKGTLLASLVDLINRTRSDHVITVEAQVEFVHDIKRSLISQREADGDVEALGAAARAAMREEPDVLVVDELRTPELVALALEAADAGCLVLGSVQAPSTVAAVQRVIEMFPAERRDQGQALLAGVLRGVVSLVLLRKRSGGRVAAREVLLNTPPIAQLILEGRTAQLPAAMEGARRQGMAPFAETLAALVRSGTVHPSHAYRKAPNREQFVAALRRDGIDTDILERLA